MLGTVVVVAAADDEVAVELAGEVDLSVTHKADIEVAVEAEVAQEAEIFVDEEHT